MWKQPWNYREGTAICGGLLLTGGLLQWSIGAVEWNIFMWPGNIVALAVFMALLGGMRLLAPRCYAFRFMLTPQAAVPALITASLLTALMGVTQQVAEGQQAIDPIGLSRMLSFWPFVLTYVWLTAIVGQIALWQIQHFNWYRLPSLTCHVGLFVALTCATLGSADMQRLKMFCVVDIPEWRAMDRHGKVTELPLAIELKHFAMTENASKHVKFASTVQILTQKGDNIETVIEVNKPFEMMGWKIYQYGYDRSMGAKSKLSIFELISDPWLPAVYTGIFLLLAGAVMVFITAQRKTCSTRPKTKEEHL